MATRAHPARFPLRDLYSNPDAREKTFAKWLTRWTPALQPPGSGGDVPWHAVPQDVLHPLSYRRADDVLVATVNTEAVSDRCDRGIRGPTPIARVSGERGLGQFASPYFLTLAPPPPPTHR